MKGHGTKFGRKKEAAVAARLTARNSKEAAKAVGVSPKTLLRWQSRAARKESGRAGGTEGLFGADILVPLKF